MAAMDNYSNLRLNDDENAAVPLSQPPPSGAQANEQLCLVGRFLTTRVIRVPMMKERMATVWQPVKGVLIREIATNTFLFQLFHPFDFTTIFSDGPWNFDGHLLLLHKLQVGEIPTSVPLFHAIFWVQIHDVPIGYMTRKVGEIFGNFIGEFVEYDPKNSSVFWKAFIRIRVKVDVRKPLKRGNKITLANGVATQVRFKYECLTVFCFFCGMLDHTDLICEKRFAMSVDDGQGGWSDELCRTPPARNGEELSLVERGRSIDI